MNKKGLIILVMAGVSFQVQGGAPGENMMAKIGVDPYGCFGRIGRSEEMKNSLIVGLSYGLLNQALAKEAMGVIKLFRLLRGGVLVTTVAELVHGACAAKSE